jgi:cyclophilin family peptidyl-prolyl cis-trans isomerase
MRFATSLLFATIVGAANAQTPDRPADIQHLAVPPSQLMNLDGHVDTGLPKSAGYGAKVPKDGDDIAIMTTTEGRIVLRFFLAKAPNHVKNFLDLAGHKFYDGTKFHRVIPGFMIQGGDPFTKDDNAKDRWGTGGPEKTVNAEFNDMEHQRGILSMARAQDPNSAGSQFFIMHKNAPFLNNQYSIFGEVLEGMDVVDKIVNAPVEDKESNRPVHPVTIQKVELVKWPVKLAS